MRREEAAFLIDEQLVEFRLHFLGDAEILPDGIDDGRHVPVPLAIFQGELRRIELPDAADVRVQNGLFAPAVRRLLGLGDEAFGIGGGDRQADQSGPLDLQSRQHRRQAALRYELRRFAQRAQQVFERFSRVGHDRVLSRECEQTLDFEGEKRVPPAKFQEEITCFYNRRGAFDKDESLKISGKEPRRSPIVY